MMKTRTNDTRNQQITNANKQKCQNKTKEINLDLPIAMNI